MASNVTQHYQLCQWEPGDKVERLDFNSDNEKIDAALKAADDKAQGAQNLAQAAYGPENSPFVVGSYIGDGAAVRTIPLGFTPKAVFVIASSGQLVYNSTSHTSYYGGLALSDSASCIYTNNFTSWTEKNTVVLVVEGGFQVGYFMDTYISCCSNEERKKFYYLALK